MKGGGDTRPHDVLGALAMTKRERLSSTHDKSGSVSPYPSMMLGLPTAKNFRLGTGCFSASSRSTVRCRSSDRFSVIGSEPPRPIGDSDVSHIGCIECFQIPVLGLDGGKIGE